MITLSVLLSDEINILCNNKTMAFIVMIVLAFFIFLMTLAIFFDKVESGISGLFG